MDCGNSMWPSIIVFGFLVMFFTDNHWGPGVRAIFDSIAYRIRGNHEGAHATQETVIASGARRGRWQWVIGVGVAVPAAIYFAIQIYEKLA